MSQKSVETQEVKIYVNFLEKFQCASRKKPTPLCSGPLLSHEWGKAATMTNEEYTKNEGAHIGTVPCRISWILAIFTNNLVNSRPSK